MINMLTTGVDLGVGKIDGVTKNMFTCGKLSCLAVKYSNGAGMMGTQNRKHYLCTRIIIDDGG